MTHYTRSVPDDTDFTLCLDFGTAKSKAFVCSSDEENPALLDLALGLADHDLDGSVYAVSSSFWIEDSGLMFATSEAVKRAMEQARNRPGSLRRSLNSLKQELSQVPLGDKIVGRLLPPEVNPTTLDLSYDDAITFYLSYLTDVAVTELQKRHKRSRYIKRRFALPCWEPSHRHHMARFLSKRLGCAQTLADTFHGRWGEGVPVAEWKEAFQLALDNADGAAYLLDRAHDAAEDSAVRWGALLEPLAAASSRVWADKGAKDLMLVLDVGAGTTDFSLFWVMQNVAQRGRRAFPVKPSAGAIRMAGDALDGQFVSQILERACLGADDQLKLRVSYDLQLQGIRRQKEELFERGQIEVKLVNDQLVSLTLDEYLASEGVANFARSLQNALSVFLEKVDESWTEPASHVKLVVTGGGCNLPMLREFSQQQWKIGTKPIHFVLTRNLPEFIEQEFNLDFQKEYPQLAVALGGALPNRLDERSELGKWMGSVQVPGPLTKFPVTGV